MNDKETKLVIPASTILKVMVFVGIAWIFIQLIELFILVLAAIIIASAIEPGVRKLVEYKIPRVFSVVIVYIITFLAFLATIYSLIPVLVEQGRNFLLGLPDVLIEIEQYIEQTQFFNVLLQDFDASQINILDNIATFLQTSTTYALDTTASVLNGFLSFLLVGVLAFYFSVEEKNVTEFVKVVAPNKYENYILSLWDRSKTKIGKWMKGQFILILITIALVYLGLLLIGVPNPFLFAVLAGLMELIPVFGAFISAIFPVILGTVEGGWWIGLITLVFFLILQQFQTQLIYPLVIKKVIGLPSIVVILALVIGGALIGFLGVIIAIPLAAVLQEFFKDVEMDRIKTYLPK